MTPVSHHYNPQVYLRQFVNPASKRELWEFDMQSGQARKSTPKDSGCEDFYHSVTRPDGSRDDESLEKAFHPIENNLPKLFKAIRNGTPLSLNEYETFIHFAALQRARCPRVRNLMQETLGEVYEYVCGASESKTSANSGSAKKHGFDIQARKEFTLLSMLTAFSEGDMPNLLRKIEWTFLRAPAGNYFFTSDDPFCCWPPPGTSTLYRGIGPSDKDVEITFPLSRRICAVGVWKPFCPKEYLPITAKQVDAINHRTVPNSWHFVYGPTRDEQILKLVEQFVAIKTKHGS
jgi:Protein of unknown function (DUF4238)